MAKQGAQARTRAGGGKAGRGGASGMITLIVLLVPVAALFFPSCLVAALLMGPTLAARLLDRSPQKHLTMTVGLLNFAGTLPSLIELWSMQHSLDMALLVIANAFAWLIAYGAAALGWLIYLAMPPVIGTYYAVSSDARIRALRRQQERLVEAWGEEIIPVSDAAAPGAAANRQAAR